MAAIGQSLFISRVSLGSLAILLTDLSGTLYLSVIVCLDLISLTTYLQRSHYQSIYIIIL